MGISDKKTAEEIEKRVEKFLNKCRSNGTKEEPSGESVPSGTTYRDITRIQCTSYTSDSLWQISIFISSKGKARNNKPYIYPDLVKLKNVVTLKQHIHNLKEYNAGNIDLLIPNTGISTPDNEVKHNTTQVSDLASKLAKIKK